MKDRAWPLLALAAAFLLAGSGAAWGKLGDRELSYALAAAGLILVGVWVAVEVSRIAQGGSTHGPDTPTPPGVLDPPPGSGTVPPASP